MIVWNGIVKNESARIERCIASLLPHVDGALIVDTGSTDGTQELIQKAFWKVGKPVKIKDAPFINFSQARNAALEFARTSELPWDYLLLCDADMELVVEKPWALNGGLAYDMRQVAGGVSYFNKRILKRTATGWYVGVTHEYLDVPSHGQIGEAYFIDHADGANRPDKLPRDIMLLEMALQGENPPGLVQRYHFYLAQSYFDMQNWAKAGEHYKKRVELGGWDEEVWNAQLHYAHCLGNLGDRAGFVWEMLNAYEIRPSRAETLYDLAKFFREFNGANYRSLLFSEPGLRLPRSNDVLFVNDKVYSHGIKEEYAISAYYDPDRRSNGARVCNALALDPRADAGTRQQARQNLFWYMKPLSEWVPSFHAQRIAFDPPENYVPMNPSVINLNGNPLALIRTVNYAITPDGRYTSRTGDRSSGGVDIISTRNFLARISYNGVVEHATEIQLPADWPEHQFELVRGFEDSRLFDNGQLWTISTVRELTPEGWCEQILAPILDYGDKLVYGDWKRVVAPGPKQNEKNWMPWVRGGEMQFVYRLGTILDSAGCLVQKHESRFAVENCSGGAQVIEIAPKLYLALVHEAFFIPGRPNRYYRHRFVEMLSNGQVLDVSPPFYFHDKQIEFAAGMALFGKELMISYGVRDEEAWIATMHLDDLLRFW